MGHTYYANHPATVLYEAYLDKKNKKIRKPTMRPIGIVQLTNDIVGNTFVTDAFDIAPLTTEYQPVYDYMRDLVNDLGSDAIPDNYPDGFYYLQVTSSYDGFTGETEVREYYTKIADKELIDILKYRKEELKC